MGKELAEEVTEDFKSAVAPLEKMIDTTAPLAPLDEESELELPPPKEAMKEASKEAMEETKEATESVKEETKDERDGVEDAVEEEVDPDELLEQVSLKRPVALNKHASYVVSDDTVTEVKEVLKKGWTCKKHCRDGKVRTRVLKLSPDETMLTWQNSSKKIMLAKIMEVRHGTSPDPSVKDRERAGTHTLRLAAEGSKVSVKSFSFILPDRTFDIECANDEEASKFCCSLQKIVEMAHTINKHPSKKI